MIALFPGGDAGARGVPAARIGSPDDAVALVARCRAGDRAAWIDLYRRHGPTVTRFMRCLLGPGADLEDPVQQVFVELAVSLGRFRQDSSFSTWLYSVSAHVARKHVRTEIRWRHRRDAFVEWLGRAPRTIDPVDALAARDALKVVAGALERMSFNHRVVWVMHELEGLGPEEIATALGTAAVTVRVRLCRARKEIAEAVRARESGRTAGAPLGGGGDDGV